MRRLEFALDTGDVVGIDHEGLVALRSGLEKTLHAQAVPEEELYDAALALGLNPTQCCPAPCALNSLLNRELAPDHRSPFSCTLRPTAFCPTGTMAAAGVGGDKDEHTAERFLLMAANSGNAGAPAVWYRLAQIRKSTPYSGFEWNIC